MPNPPGITREVIAEYPYGRKKLRICVTEVDGEDEPVVEVVDYNPQTSEYGHGVIIPIAIAAEIGVALKVVGVRGPH